MSHCTCTLSVILEQQTIQLCWGSTPAFLTDTLEAYFLSSFFPTSFLAADLFCILVGVERNPQPSVATGENEVAFP